VNKHAAFKWKDAISGSPVSPGSTKALVRWSEKIKYILIPYFLSNIYAKNCRNRTVYVKIIANCKGGTFFETQCIYVFGTLAPWRNFARCKSHFTSKSCVLLYWQRYCKALQQRASAKLCGVVQGIELRNFHRGRHLYSAGRPSRWASAHILVCKCFMMIFAC